MSLRKSGIWCDVCNLPKPLEPTTEFKMTRVYADMMNCCDKCLEPLKEFNKDKDPKHLPPGPFKDYLDLVLKRFKTKEQSND